MYHAQEITTPPFYGGEWSVTGKGVNTTYSAMISLNTAAYCVIGPLRAGGVQEDPELTFSGSQERGRRICADNAILMMYFELNCIIAYLALMT